MAVHGPAISTPSRSWCTTRGVTTPVPSWRSERPPTAHAARMQAGYSKIVARRASTSSMICSGTASTCIPFRAPTSSARGWSHRITPVVRVPAPWRETAKPRLRAKLPPLVIGTTTGVPVSLLNGPGETISTGRVPCCSWPAVGSRLTSQMSPRSTTVVRCRPVLHPSRRRPRPTVPRSRRTAPTVRRVNTSDASAAE